MTQGLIPHDKVKDFMLAGKALVVIHSLKTKDSYRYTIRKKTDGIYWITFGTFNSYIGYIKDNTCYLKPPTNASAKINKGTEVFEWTWQHINHLPDSVQVFHMGMCGVCGRPLTDPESIISGIGPICRNK